MTSEDNRYKGCKEDCIYLNNFREEAEDKCELNFFNPATIMSTMAIVADHGRYSICPQSKFFNEVEEKFNNGMGK